MKHPILTAEVITLDTPAIAELSGSGWGDNAQRTEVCGQVAQIAILKDGKLEWSIRITETGRIIFTDYQHRCYQMDTVHSLNLEPVRNWQKHPAR